MNILLEIQNKYNTFSEKEKKIGDWILNPKNSIDNISITELSKKIGTSNATITRFCKKIGCDSFVHMKINLGALGSEHKEVCSEDEIFKNVYKHYDEAIKRTKELIDREVIYSMVKEIKEAKRIFIYGIGSSGFTAQEMMQRFIRMGFNAIAITDSHMMIINSGILTKDDLVIGISISGETKEINEAVRLAKKREARILSFTGFKNSTMGRAADFTFQVYNTSFLGERFINTQFSVMYVLDVISTVLLREKGLKDKMKMTLDAIIKS